MVSGPVGMHEHHRVIGAWRVGILIMVPGELREKPHSLERVASIVKVAWESVLASLADGFIILVGVDPA